MKAIPEPIRIRDPQTGQTWHIPARETMRLNADVIERWFINCALPLDQFRTIVSAPFLEPDVRHGCAVLSLCRIRFRHAAPDWMPLNFGPGADSCALRVGCIDTRDGTPAVWICKRITTHVLGGALQYLHFPVVEPTMYTTGNGRFPLGNRDGSLTCTMHAGRAANATLFTNAAEMNAWVVAGVRSYAQCAQPGLFEIVDLEKASDNQFEFLPHLYANLHTTWGTFRSDGIYRTINGRYQWRCLGHVDKQGNAVQVKKEKLIPGELQPC
jgi:hypothetical protein